MLRVNGSAHAITFTARQNPAGWTPQKIPSSLTSRCGSICAMDKPAPIAVVLGAAAAMAAGILYATATKHRTSATASKLSAPSPPAPVSLQLQTERLPQPEKTGEVKKKRWWIHTLWTSGLAIVFAVGLVLAQISGKEPWPLNAAIAGAVVFSGPILVFTGAYFLPSTTRHPELKQQLVDGIAAPWAALLILGAALNHLEDQMLTDEVLLLAATIPWLGAARALIQWFSKRPASQE